MQVLYLSSREYLFKIPPDIPMTKYSGFTPLNYWESAVCFSNPEYLVICYQASRYSLEERHSTGYHFSQIPMTITHETLDLRPS